MFSFSPCGDGVELGKGEVPRLINGISQPGKWSAHNKLSAAYLWVFWLPFILIRSQGYTEQTAHPRMAMQALKCALPQWWVERAYLPEWLTVAGPWGRVFRGFLRRIPAEWSFCTHACMLSHFSCVWLFVTLWTVAHQAPLSMEFSRQEWVAVPSSRGSSRPRDQTLVSGICCTGRWVLYTSSPPGKPT